MDFISSQELREEVLVFFDVSLFTNIPTDLAICVAEEYLKGDEGLDERTCTVVSGGNCEVVRVVLECDLFSIPGKFNQQTQGTAMGFPVSVIVANLVMENVEQKRALSKYVGRQPLFWKRYVDDTCTAIMPDEVEAFHHHIINTIEPQASIQFTREMKDDGKLPFLDVQLVRCELGAARRPVFTFHITPSFGP